MIAQLNQNEIVITDEQINTEYKEKPIMDMQESQLNQNEIVITDEQINTEYKEKPIMDMQESQLNAQPNQEETIITNEQINDVPLLLGIMIQMGLQKVLDSHIPTHGNQRKLSWGWTAVIWSAYILAVGDHRKVAMQEYVKGMKITIESITGQEIDELDFTTDRLGNLLEYLNNKSYWDNIEKDLTERTIIVYELPTDTVRCDATTISGYHGEDKNSLFQFGHSKDDDNLRQIKLMIGTLDPLGLPLAADVVSGERADDGLYIPLIERINRTLQKTNVLFCGDCKMSAFAIRLYIKALNNHYLSPLPMTGKTVEDMKNWIEEGIAQNEQGKLQQVYRVNEKGEQVLIAQGYETERELSGVVDGKKIEWTERILIVKSDNYAAQQEKGLEKRLKNAQQDLKSLTPSRGPGKRQITDENILQERIEQILKAHKVTGLLTVVYRQDIEKQPKYDGKGRGSEDRPKKLIAKIRYQIIEVTCEEEKIAELKKTFGWKAFVTDAPKERLSFEKAVLCYRKEYRVERIFNRLKDRLNISPLFVRTNEQITGMTHLLTLGVRVQIIIEHVIRRSLRQDNAVLHGLYREAKKKATSSPTAERILRAFSNITLTCIPSENHTKYHVTPLSKLQMEILKRLGLDCALYQDIGVNTTSEIKSAA